MGLFQKRQTQSIEEKNLSNTIKELREVTKNLQKTAHQLEFFTRLLQRTEDEESQS